MAISVPFECGAEEAELTLEKRLEALECGNIRFQPVDYGVRLCAETADGEAFSLTLYFNQKSGRSTKLVTMGKAGNAGERLAPQLALQACESRCKGDFRRVRLKNCLSLASISERTNRARGIISGRW